MKQQNTDTEKLVAAIVEVFFTNGAGQKADRLVLVDSDGRDLGGWGKKPFADRLRDMLAAARNKE